MSDAQTPEATLYECPNPEEKGRWEVAREVGSRHGDVTDEMQWEKQKDYLEGVVGDGAGGQ
ncbi:hypothetical protein NHX12_027809, partial [Muraenolepis orangiensis]